MILGLSKKKDNDIWTYLIFQHPFNI